jgi:hypothetical protein
MKSIVLNEIMKTLNYTDQRSARRWCRGNSVTLIKQGKTEFAIESNFREAIERPFIAKLKKLHGDGWEMVYNLYKDGNIPALDTLQKAVSVGHKVFKPIKKKENLFTKKLDAVLKGEKAA